MHAFAPARPTVKSAVAAVLLAEAPASQELAPPEKNAMSPEIPVDSRGEAEAEVR